MQNTTMIVYLPTKSVLAEAQHVNVTVTYLHLESRSDVRVSLESTE
jgi:hypothetical protein